MNYDVPLSCRSFATRSRRPCRAGLAQRYLIQALRLARAAGDFGLGGEVLAGMSHQAVYVGRPADAIDLARTARISAGKAGIPLLQAEALVTEAPALALVGDRTGSLRAIASGEREFQRADNAERPKWLGYFDEAYMSAKIAHSLRELDDCDNAEQHAHRSLRMADGYMRGRMFNTALLASIHAEQGEIDRACAVGSQALHLTVGLHSTRTHRYVRDVTVRLEPHNKTPAVRAFIDEARQLSTST